MGKHVTATLVEVHNNQKISRETDHEFLHILEQGLLLALKESGILNEIQYRLADERHTAHYQEWIRSNIGNRHKI